MAIIKSETDFRSVEESFAYSSASLLQRFPSRFNSLEAARLYEHQPDRIANSIYANRIGNGDEASGDGWRYRGRGLFMFAGRENYAYLSRLMHVDLISAPYLLTDPEIGFAAAAAYWNSREFNSNADTDDSITVKRRMDGGLQGLERFRLFLQQAKAAVEPKPP